MTTIVIVMCLILMNNVTPLKTGVFDTVIDRHNLGYVLQHMRQVQMANYNAKLIFHLRIPVVETDLDEGQHNCTSNRNISLPCLQMQPLLLAARDIRIKAQRHLQTQLQHINDVIEDLPREERRTRRGFLTSMLSGITGLATQDQLDSVIQLLERIESGIYEASEMWGNGAKNLVAAFEVEQKRLDNVFDILKYYRQTISDLQVEMVKTRHDRTGFTLIAQLLNLLGNTTFQVAEVEALYTGVQMLMGGRVSHFLLPHDTLRRALDHVQTHLTDTEPHMVLARQDNGFYYGQATFRSFRAGQILVLIIDAPVAMNDLVHPINLYEMIKVSLPTPESEVYYSTLATDIKILGFSRDADFILQVMDSDVGLLPQSEVWLATTSAPVLLSRSRPTCARALIEGELTDIKSLCRYNVHKSAISHGATRLFGNTFLFSNISEIHLRCMTNNFSSEVTDKTITLTDIQSIYTFDCHCEIYADEIRITADLNSCNMTENVTSVMQVQYPINLAFLSEFFDESQLINISADTLLNHSVEIQVPKLLIADKLLDEKFGLESGARFDMSMVINSTKQSVKVYEDLSHYLFSQMIRAHNKDSSFDLLSGYTWISIFSWITSAVAIVMVVLFHFKVKSMTLLMMTHSAKAAPVPEIPKLLSLTTTTPVTQPPIDLMKEWLFHTDIVSKVVPLEVLILLCLIFLFLFKFAKMIYKRRRRTIARTTLMLEVGNDKDSVILPILDLKHPPNSHRFVINKADVQLRMIERNLSAEIWWSKGVMFMNSALDFPIVLPEKLRVDFWKIKLLKSILNGPYFALIQVLNGASELCELVVLRPLSPDQQFQQLYPTVSGMM